jgi:hypothetical protein
VPIDPYFTSAHRGYVKNRSADVDALWAEIQGMSFDGRRAWLAEVNRRGAASYAETICRRKLRFVAFHRSKAINSRRRYFAERRANKVPLVLTGYNTAPR